MRRTSPDADEMPPGGPTVSRRESEERSEEHTSELQSHSDLVCRLLLEKKKYKLRRKIDVRKTQNAQAQIQRGTRVATPHQTYLRPSITTHFRLHDDPHIP